MTEESLADVLAETDDVVEWLRGNGGLHGFEYVPDEHTNWLDEQRAITETVILSDLSNRTKSNRITGPDCLDLFADLCVNDFSSFPIGRAKQAVLCGPDGHLMGDGPLLRLGAEEFWGLPTCEDWIAYHVETGGYDVALEVAPVSEATGTHSDEYIFQVQGPNAIDLLDELTDADLTTIDFYGHETVRLADHDVRVFGHGMSTEPGFELHGPYEEAEAVRAAIRSAGEAHGLRELGERSYLTLSIRLGWVPPGVPPIFDGEATADFREWLPADRPPATISIGGSYRGEDVTDYYMRPVELGYGPLVDLDHDFVGRDAVEAELEDPQRTLVSLVWDDAAVIDVYASLFDEGPTRKQMALPRIGWSRAPYDAVMDGGSLVGISHTRAYQWDIRSVVSLAVVDLDHAESGTTLAVRWGEPGGSPNPRVERHEPVEIPATVRPAPYTADRRRGD